MFSWPGSWFPCNRYIGGSRPPPVPRSMSCNRCSMRLPRCTVSPLGKGSADPTYLLSSVRSLPAPLEQSYSNTRDSEYHPSRQKDPLEVAPDAAARKGRSPRYGNFVLHPSWTTTDCPLKILVQKVAANALMQMGTQEPLQ